MVTVAVGNCECGGRRHVMRGGRWVECSCLRRERSVRLWRAAKLPARHDSFTWRRFLAAYRTAQTKDLLGAARELQQGRCSAQLVLTGHKEGRALAGTLLLRDALAGGLSAELVDLPRLIDYEFRRNEDDRGSDPFSKGAVVVHLGSEPRHSWNRPMLEKLVRGRWDAGLATILLADEPRSIGSLYASADVSEAIRENYKVVHVRPLELEVPQA